jgi:hypothetical protein
MVIKMHLNAAQIKMTTSISNQTMKRTYSKKYQLHVQQQQQHGEITVKFKSELPVR